jgi:hypothetical protein
MTRRYCECGRPLVAFRKPGRHSKRKAQAGQPAALREHDLCPACFRKAMDRANNPKARWQANRGLPRIQEE